MKKKVKLSRIVLICMIVILFLPVIKNGLDKIFVYDSKSGKLNVYKSFFYDYVYVIDKEGNVCLEYYHGDEVEVIVPDTVWGKPVTMIGDYCFDDNASIEKVVLSSSVVEIGFGSFKNCSSLKEIIVNGDADLSHINRGAFGNCSNLEMFNCGNNIEFIGENAFENCGKLSTINEQLKLTRINYGAFKNSGLIELTIDNLEKLESDAFENTPYLESLRKGNEEFVVKNHILFECNSTGKTIVIPDDVMTVDCDFSKCPNVEMIVFKNIEVFNDAIIPKNKSVELVFLNEPEDVAGFDEESDITVIWLEEYSNSRIDGLCENYGIKTEILSAAKMQELLKEHGVSWKY